MSEYEPSVPFARATVSRHAICGSGRATGVINLGAADAPLGPARTSWPTCDTIWSDNSPEFPLGVRRSDFFAPICLACGGSLHKWEMEQGAQPAPEPPSGRRNIESCRPMFARRSI